MYKLDRRGGGPKMFSRTDPKIERRGVGWGEEWVHKSNLGSYRLSC